MDAQNKNSIILLIEAVSYVPTVTINTKQIEKAANFVSKMATAPEPTPESKQIQDTT